MLSVIASMNYFYSVHFANMNTIYPIIFKPRYLLVCWHWDVMTSSIISLYCTTLKGMLIRVITGVLRLVLLLFVREKNTYNENNTSWPLWWWRKDAVITWAATGKGQLRRPLSLAEIHHHRQQLLSPPQDHGFTLFFFLSTYLSAARLFRLNHRNSLKGVIC